MRALDELYDEDPTRGTRRMSHELQKREFNIGRDRTRRLMQRMRMKTISCRPRTTVCYPAKYRFPYLLWNLKINRPNQVWALDISSIPMERGCMFLLVIIDWHSWPVVGWSLSITMAGKGRGIDNVIVERFFRTIKKDKLPLESLETGADVQRACHEFIPYDSHKRDHSSIGNQPPMVFYNVAASTMKSTLTSSHMCPTESDHFTGEDGRGEQVLLHVSTS